MKEESVMRKKFLSWLLTITMILPLFGGIPISLPASAVEVAEIPNGDYTISADCVYRLVSGYSGLVTINPSAKNVTLIGSGDASANSAAVKVAAGRSDGACAYHPGPENGKRHGERRR